MPITKENYQVMATDLQGLVLRLNSILSRLSDRLDKLEGLRTELETKSGTFDGDITAKNITAKGSVLVNDSNEDRIHSMD